MNEKLYLTMVRQDFSDYEVENSVIKFIHKRKNESNNEGIVLYGVPVSMNGRSVIMCTTQAFFEEGCYIGVIVIKDINEFIFKGTGILSELFTSTEFEDHMLEIAYEVLDGKINTDKDNFYSYCFQKWDNLVDMINDQDMVFFGDSMCADNVVVSVEY